MQLNQWTKIKAVLPEVKHVAMFYNNGTIFQTTFEQEINIPKLGENLAEILNHTKKLYDICNYNFEVYKKIIFETDDMSIIILKLGEDSNIALFFKKEEEKELKLTAIKRYMTRIEELINMDERGLILQDIIAKEEEIKPDDLIVGYCIALISLIPGFEGLYIQRMYAQNKEIRREFEKILRAWSKDNKVRKWIITVSKNIKAFQRQHKFI